jgi:hypothetical protein
MRDHYRTRDHGKKPVIKKASRVKSTIKMWRNAGTVGGYVGYIMLAGFGTKGDRPRVYSAGPIQIGTENYVVCVVPGYKHIYLGRNGKILMLSGNPGYGNPRLHDEVKDPTNLSPAEVQLWGDAICRNVIDLYTSADITDSVSAMSHRYGMVLRAHLEGAVVDCAAVGVERSMLDFVQGADRTYTIEDVAPHWPTIKHAIYLSLALCLEPDTATQLIEYAAFMELKLPIMQREVAYAMYIEARRQLSVLCPQWLMHAKCTNWKQMETSVSELMQLQFYRSVNDARERGLALEAAVGLRLSMTQLGSAPLSGSYVNRTMNPDIGLGLLAELKNITAEDLEEEE